MTPEQARLYEKRKAAVSAMIRGEKVGVVTRVFQVPRRTVFQWLSRYRHGGWHALYDRPRSGRKPKLNEEVIAWLYDAITLGDPRQYQFSFCLWTLKIIRRMLMQEWNIDLSISSISRLLRHMGLTPKKPTYKAYKRDPEELDQFLKDKYPRIRQRAKKLGAEIFFVDEASIRADEHQGRTWAPSREEARVEDSGERFSVKLISAVSPRGQMRFEAIEGRMNSGKFIAFLKKLWHDVDGPIIVIADNAKYHKSREVKRFTKQNAKKIEVEYLPPYHPELNPDEQVWNHLRGRVGRMFFRTKEELERLVFNTLRSIQKRKRLILSFFRLENTRYAAPV